MEAVTEVVTPRLLTVAVTVTEAVTVDGSDSDNCA